MTEKEQNMKTLIVVDMQNDFIDGALGTKWAACRSPWNWMLRTVIS